MHWIYMQLTYGYSSKTKKIRKRKRGWSRTENQEKIAGRDQETSIIRADYFWKKD